jgi:uncharacterized sporulation protein YeaH/YhbH (DUF444 family)
MQNLTFMLLISLYIYAQLVTQIPVEHNFCISNLSHMFRVTHKNWVTVQIVKYVSYAQLIQLLHTRSARTYNHHRAHKENTKDIHDTTDIYSVFGKLLCT